MSDSFKMDNLPFSLLDEREQALMNNHLDIAYFQKGETIIEAGKPPEGVFIIFKGRVAESDVTEIDEKGIPQSSNVFVHYEDEDYFGGWSALHGTAIHNFIAVEETICHLLPTKVLLELMSSNHLFADYFQQNLTAKREIVAQHGQSQDMAEFMLARINDGTIREPLIVPEGTNLHEATRLMREMKADCVLAKKKNRYGMVTGTDLLDAVVLKGMSLDADVSDIASYRLITAEPDDYLFNALILMTRQQIERVVVMRGPEELVGIVELTDVLSHFSSHSHVIGLRVERAQSIEELREAALGLTDLIKALISTGVKIRFTMELLAAMNGRIISKLFDLIIPNDVRPHVCLIVMGSEGRGEQIMKTDQDNALLVRDGLEWSKLTETMRLFSETLISFGFPPCPGNIMVSNPEWVNSIDSWTRKLTRWSQNCDGVSVMNLAIAVDGKPIAGNIALFKVARNAFLRSIRNNDIFFSHFAKAALNFDTPLTFFGNLKDKGQLDIKKGGIFPIVHGIRTMALEERILETNTFKRIEALVEMGQIPRIVGDNLMEALSLFIQVRLKQQIQRVEASENGLDKTPNAIDLQRLNKLERDLLRDALRIVKDFKKFLSTRYHIGS
ncbi:putative nucleotidyltransferase substrate binding domain-containing protein [Nitrincola tapanii]|uniref:Cyclic nucleotide-binding/CBS domain-containing protein n=1 Tax=Nitrincola tapanii TaxID=1708751 RepID=A0A5A9W738_9GAMM|nr:putative nucleotidyltransferase substrate binding domain-containing protein [Nitrincola tapanii]KAA0876610.1 cyclic nucleotide-binding/CBS domain-containing protein [Nitrincola tapanii]